MAYEKLNLPNGTVLDASHLAHMEDGIANAGSSPELLWENKSPTSSFAEQTIALDLSEYIWLVIEYAYSTSVNKNRSAVYYIDGTTDYTLAIASSTSNKVGARSAFLSSDGVRFASATYSGDAGNTYVIPIRIFGVKGVAA